MKIILESLRFIFIYFLSAMIARMLLFFILSMAGANPEQYDWLVLIVAFLFTLIVYKYTGWGKVFHQYSLWLAIVLIVIFTFIIPDRSPVYLFASRYVYSYGFPLPFLKLYVDGGDSFLLPNLFADGFMDWSANLNVLFNFFFYYILLSLIMKVRQSDGLITE